MKKKHFKEICKSVFEKQKFNYKRRVQYRLLYNLSMDEIKKEDPDLFPLINDEDSIESDDNNNVIYNVREVFIHEDDYIDQNEYYDGDSTCDEDKSDLEKYINNLDADSKKEKNEINLVLDTLSDFFTEKGELNVIVQLTSWFPIFVNGVCRFLGRMKTKNSRQYFDTVTEAVIDYKHSEGIIVTCKSQYKLVGPMDLSYLSNDSTESDAKFQLSEESWLKDVITISKLSEFRKKSLTNAKLKGLSKEKIQKFKVMQVSKSRKNVIFGSYFKVIPNSNEIDIRMDLEKLLRLCQNSNNWQFSFKEFLIKIGQNHKEVERAIYDVKNAGFRNVDIDEPDDYDDFVMQGEMFNSTINNSVEDLYLWSIMKNDANKFCITGLIKVGNVFKEVIPTPIKSVSFEGTCVMTEEEHYKLLGPMYMLSINCCYPQSDNYRYLDLFQEHFMKGLPKYWKSLVFIIHVICGMCEKLKYQKNISDVSPNTKEDKSPSYSSACIGDTALKINEQKVSEIASKNFSSNTKEDKSPSYSSSCIGDTALNIDEQNLSKKDLIIERESPELPKQQVSTPSFINKSILRKSVKSLSMYEESNIPAKKRTSISKKKNSKKVLELLNNETETDICSLEKEKQEEFAKTPQKLLRICNNSVSTAKLSERRVSDNNTGINLVVATKVQEDICLREDLGLLPRNIQSNSSNMQRKNLSERKKRQNKNNNFHKSNKENIPKRRRLKDLNPDESGIDRVIQVSFNSRISKSSKFSLPYKSLKIKSHEVQEDRDFIYQPIVGYPVNLSKLPITRSGRMSLPPPDILSRTKFEKVGDEVHFISESETKMVFQR